MTFTTLHHIGEWYGTRDYGLGQATRMRLKKEDRPDADRRAFRHGKSAGSTRRIGPPRPVEPGSVGGGEKGYQFGGLKGTTWVVTQWTPSTSPRPLDSSLVALRQPAIFHAAAEVFSSSSKCSRESSEIFFVFSQPAAARFMSARRVRDYVFCNQLTPLCGISGWVHPPLSSVSGLAPMAPPKWSHRTPPLTRLRRSAAQRLTPPSFSDDITLADQISVEEGSVYGF